MADDSRASDGASRRAWALVVIIPFDGGSQTHRGCVLRWDSKKATHFSRATVLIISRRSSRLDSVRQIEIATVQIEIRTPQIRSDVFLFVAWNRTPRAIPRIQGLRKPLRNLRDGRPGDLMGAALPLPPHLTNLQRHPLLRSQIRHHRNTLARPALDLFGVPPLHPHAHVEIQIPEQNKQIKRVHAHVYPNAHAHPHANAIHFHMRMCRPQGPPQNPHAHRSANASSTTSLPQQIPILRRLDQHTRQEIPIPFHSGEL